MGTNADFQGRIEDDRLITGAGRYVADLALENTAHAVFVRSPSAHAVLRSLDVADAAAAPGVIAVLSADDLLGDGAKNALPCGVTLKRPDGNEAFQAARQVLVRDRVRHLGEALAVVVAETRQAALDAAELVAYDLDDLPVAAGAPAALAADAPLVWDEVPGNIAFVWSKGDADATAAALDGAHHVARLRGHVTRVMAHTMEPRGMLAYPSDDGRLVVHASTQNPYPMRAQIAGVLGIDASAIKVVAADVGGSFGLKSGIYPEDAAIAWAARRLGRPVRWIADRGEGFLADDHGRDVHIEADLGLDANGKFLAFRVRCTVDIGAYLSRRSLFMINNMGGIAGIYRIGSILGEIQGVHTNTQVSTPYRGAGRPEATYAIERTIDLAAAELGIDPFELRMRNVVTASAMPYETGFLFTYDCGEFDQNMQEAARMIDRAGFAARRAEAAARGKLRGLGIANPIEVAGGPYNNPGKDFSRLEVAEDGTVTLYAGVMSVGQGLETMLSNLAAERLGISVDNFRYVSGDTDDLPNGRGNGGSSSTPVGGACVAITTDNLIARGRELAARMFGVDDGAIDFADGTFSAEGTNHRATLAEVAAFALTESPDGYQASGEFTPPAVTFPNGCHMCEVEVDPETGVSRIVDYVVVEDIGNVINPTLAQGQMHGGIAQGLGQAFGEQIVFDPETGQLLTGSFMDYQMPRADDMPAVRFVTRPVPTKVNPLGAKGIGEAGTVGSIAAAVNAVCDALSPLGVRHIAMPMTPARVWTAIREAQG